MVHKELSYLNSCTDLKESTLSVHDLLKRAELMHELMENKQNPSTAPSSVTVMVTAILVAALHKYTK